MPTDRAEDEEMQRRILGIALVALTFCAFVSSSAYATVYAAPQRVKIELSLSHRVLRGELMVISGRLSTTPDDFPIALAKIRLQYYRFGETDFTREVVMITSNPGGRFEDRFNTTSLLRIGTWVVNASFPSQLGYESASTVDTFTIVVQPALSLYVSSHSLSLGQRVVFDGLLFACIPCTQDEVSVTFSRPDNTSISIPLHLAPTGGPYPGGYYNGTFTPDVTGSWHVRAVWNGNDVTLPAYSRVEELTVGVRGTGSDTRGLFYVTIIVAVLGIVTLGVVLWRRHSWKDSTGSD
jgi:hypothetical protein